MILIPGSFSFAKLVTMSFTPAKSAGDARYVSQDPFICFPIQSRLQSVLGVPSFYLKRNCCECGAPEAAQNWQHCMQLECCTQNNCISIVAYPEVNIPVFCCSNHFKEKCKSCVKVPACCPRLFFG